MLSFETITLAPFDRSMIIEELLADHEKNWLNDYHEWVRKELLPLLNNDESAWLIEATEPIGSE
ncbi:MAG: M24 family metallopeptidase C-terminal domain-containing protein [Pseudomonadota bacterium]|nr:M24 family metallopeptidase C-terminal domain-containing protein [Pseudomonadota bacterium]